MDFLEYVVMSKQFPRKGLRVALMASASQPTYPEISLSVVLLVWFSFFRLKISMTVGGRSFITTITCFFSPRTTLFALVESQSILMPRSNAYCSAKLNLIHLPVPLRWDPTDTV